MLKIINCKIEKIIIQTLNPEKYKPKNEYFIVKVKKKEIKKKSLI